VLQQRAVRAPLAPLSLLPLTVPLTVPPPLPPPLPPLLPPPLFAAAMHCNCSFVQDGLRPFGKCFGNCARSLVGRSPLDAAAFYYNRKSPHNTRGDDWKKARRDVSSVRAALRLLPPSCAGYLPTLSHAQTQAALSVDCELEHAQGCKGEAAASASVGRRRRGSLAHLFATLPRCNTVRCCCCCCRTQRQGACRTSTPTRASSVTRATICCERAAPHVVLFSAALHALLLVSRRRRRHVVVPVAGRTSPQLQ
jgi:hypothetical protein